MYIRQNWGKIPAQSCFGLAGNPQLKTHNYIQCDTLQWAWAGPLAPTAAAPLQLSQVTVQSAWGGQTQTRWKLPMPGATILCYETDHRGSQARAMGGRDLPRDLPRSQRGFRNKVSSPTRMSLAELQPHVPSKVHQRLCMDFLTGPDPSPGLAPGSGARGANKS